jgi:hypothetical protein
MNEATVLPNPVLPPERKCVLAEVFDGNFIELLRLVPRNPLIRALVLRLTGKLPPANCVTFEQVRDWIERHCEPQVITTRTRQTRRSPGGGIRIAVEFSEVEYGRADYSLPRSGTDEFFVNAEDLLGIVQDAVESGGGLEEVVEMVADRIDDDAWNQCDPNLDDYGDYDSGEHDSNDSGEARAEYSRTEIRNAVLAFVRERHPELADEL